MARLRDTGKLALIGGTADRKISVSSDSISICMHSVGFVFLHSYDGSIQLETPAIFTHKSSHASFPLARHRSGCLPRCEAGGRLNTVVRWNDRFQVSNERRYAVCGRDPYLIEPDFAV